VANTPGAPKAAGNSSVAAARANSKTEKVRNNLTSTPDSLLYVCIMVECPRWLDIWAESKAPGQDMVLPFG